MAEPRDALDGTAVNLETFCAYSVFHINIRPEGKASLCCRAHNTITVNGRELSLHHDSFEDIWNSAYMRETRRKMVLGERVEACSGCYQMEREGGQSLRIHANTYEETLRRGGLDAVYQLARTAVSTKDGMAPPPSSLHFWLGNVCNLKCRMCHPHFSSQIAADRVHSRLSVGSAGLGSRVVLLPDFLKGVTYQGLDDTEMRDGVLFRLVSPQRPAVISLPATGDPVRRIEVSGVRDDRAPCSLVVSLQNGATIERTVNDSAWSFTVDFETPIECKTDITIALRMEPARSVFGVRHLSITSVRSIGKALPREFTSRFVENPNWFDNEDVLFKEILASPESVRFINFAGGEPLLHARIADILSLFVERGHHRNITL